MLTFAGSIDSIKDDSFDIIAANVNRSQIINMLPKMHALMAKDGVCLISGILDTEENMIRHACENEGLLITDMLYDLEWLAFETRTH